jgi:hypothetical protein
MVEVAREFQTFLSDPPADAEEYDRAVISLMDKFPGLTFEQIDHAMAIARDDKLMNLECTFEPECEEFHASLDGLPKKPEAVHELEEADHRTPLRRFLAKRRQQQ